MLSFIGQRFFTFTDHNSVFSFKVVDVVKRNAIKLVVELDEEFKSSSEITYHFEQYIDNNLYINLDKNPDSIKNVFPTEKDALQKALSYAQEKTLTLESRLTLAKNKEDAIKKKLEELA
jgi:hypothetical protein